MLFFRKTIFLIFIFILALTSCNSENISLIPVKRYVVPQNGMYPTLSDGSTFWVKKRPFFRTEKVCRGEIIVYYQKEKDKIYHFVWRVVGLPGDKIEIKDTSILVNGEILKHEKKDETLDKIIFSEKSGDREYLVAYDKQPDFSSRIEINTVVPKGYFYLLGDNRDNALDSRFKGAIAFENVIGNKI